MKLLWGVPGLSLSVASISSGLRGKKPMVNQQQGHVSLVHMEGKGWAAWWATVAQTAEEIHSGFNRRVSQYSVVQFVVHGAAWPQTCRTEACQLLQVNMLCYNDFQINLLHYCESISTKYAHWLALSTQRNSQSPISPGKSHSAFPFVFSTLALMRFAYQTCPTQMTTMTLHHMPHVHWTRTVTLALKAFHWPVSDFISMRLFL